MANIPPSEEDDVLTEPKKKTKTVRRKAKGTQKKTKVEINSSAELGGPGAVGSEVVQSKSEQQEAMDNSSTAAFSEGFSKGFDNNQPAESEKDIIINIARGLQSHLESLSEGDFQGRWRFQGITESRYSNPGGSWNDPAFTFVRGERQLNLAVEWLDESPYLAVDSINRGMQTLNYDFVKYASISDEHLFVNDNLVMSYGTNGRIPREKLLALYKEVDWNEPYVITHHQLSQINYALFVDQFLDWGEKWDLVKEIIANDPNFFGNGEEVEPDPPEGTEEAPVTQDGYVELGQNLINDVVAEEDHLGFRNTVEVVASFLKSRNTRLPLTLAIDGAWGTGKSSFMNLLVKRLEGKSITDKDNNQASAKSNENYSFTPSLSVNRALKVLDESEHKETGDISKVDTVKAESERRFETVHFNAWRYGDGEKLTSSLVRYVIEAVANKKPVVEREEFWFRLNLNRLDKEKVRRDLYVSVAPSLIVGFLCFMLIGVLGWVYVLQGGGSDNFVNWLIYIGAMLVPGGWGIKNFLKARNKAASIKFIDYFNIPDYDKLGGAQHAIEEDFRFVVEQLNSQDKALALFVDDLDRCTPTQVVKVIEDINVFFALQNLECVFILGLHRDLVATSIEQAYRQTVNAISDKPFMEDELPFGQRFLEKIIQFTIPLPDPSDETLDAFIEYLANNKTTVQDINNEEVRAKTQEFRASIEAIESFEDDDGDLDEKTRQFSDTLVSSGLDKEAATEWVEKIVEVERIKKVAESIDERGDEVTKVLNALKPGLRGNARQYVRLFNELRFQYHLEAANLSSPPDIQGLLTLAKRSAINVEWPTIYRMIVLNRISFDELLKEGQDQKTLETFLGKVDGKGTSPKLDVDVKRLFSLLSTELS